MRRQVLKSRSSLYTLRRPEMELLEDRRPVAESLGAIASLLSVMRAAQATPPPPDYAASHGD